MIWTGMHACVLVCLYVRLCVCMHGWRDRHSSTARRTSRNAESCHPSSPSKERWDCWQIHLPFRKAFGFEAWNSRCHWLLSLSIGKSAEALDFRMGVMGATCLLRCHVFAQPTLNIRPWVCTDLRWAKRMQQEANSVKSGQNILKQMQAMQAWTSLRCISKFKSLIWKLGSFLWKRLSLRKARWGSSWPYSTCRRSIPNCCESRVQLPVSQHGETETCNFGTSAASAASASPLRTPKDPNLADADFGVAGLGEDSDIGDIGDWTTGRLGSGREFNFLAVRPPFHEEFWERYGKVGIGGYPQVLSPVKKWPSSPSCGTQTTGESQSESVTDLRAGMPVHFKILPATRKTSRKNPIFCILKLYSMKTSNVWW